MAGAPSFRRCATAEAEGNLRGAEEELERAVRLQPQSAGLHYLLGNERLNQGRFDDAMRELQRVLDGTPDFAPARELMHQLAADAS